MLGATDGNCWSACLASILDVDLADVPNFVGDDDDPNNEWPDNCIEWLKERSYLLDWWRIGEGGDPSGWAIAGGLARGRGDIRHACVFFNGQPWFDPHPSNAGLREIEEWYIIRKEGGALA